MNKANKDNKHLYSSIANDPSKSLELFFSTWALKNKIRKQNPSIFHFNNQSFFIGHRTILIMGKILYRGFIESYDELLL